MLPLLTVMNNIARPLPLRGSSAGLLAIRRHIRRIIGLIVEDTRPTPAQDALQQIGPGKAGETANDLASDTPARANNEGHPRHQRRRRPLHRPRVKPTPRRIRPHMRPNMLRPPITASGIGAQMHNPARNPLAAAIHRPKAIRDQRPARPHVPGAQPANSDHQRRPRASQPRPSALSQPWRICLMRGNGRRAPLMGLYDHKPVQLSRIMFLFLGLQSLLPPSPHSAITPPCPTL